MVTASVITTGVNAVFLALTPIERWHAARQLDSATSDQRLLILLSVVVIIILTVLFIAASYRHKAKEQNVTNKVFVNYAQRMGLSQPEQMTGSPILELAGDSN